MLKKYFPHTSKLVFGCMGLGGDWDKSPIEKAHEIHSMRAIECALDNGINVFDHADIYTLGKAEKVFGRLLSAHPDWREKMIIQSKCSIRFADKLGPKRYDFSADWIRQSVERSLINLNIEQLDILLLHRPDPLMQVEEVAQVLSELHQQGKVLHFGVSNMHWAQIDYLQQALGQPVVANQLEMSLAKLDWIEDGITTGSHQYAGGGYATGTIEYCQRNQVQLQAWGSLAQGRFSKPDSTCATSKLVDELAASYQTSKEAIVLAFLLRHPANIQPVIGTSSPQRIEACAQATSVDLSREHWYQLLETSRGSEVP